MADIISSIQLLIKGGDQGAREIGKIKKAYDETDASAKKLSAGGGTAGSSDPFTRATGGSAQADSDFRRSWREGQDRLRKEREEKHEANKAASTFGGMARGGIGAVAQVGSGNLAGGLASGLGGLASLGAVGIAAGVIASGVMGVSALAGTDMERRKQLEVSGLRQRLGQSSYESMIPSVMKLKSRGLDAQVMPLLQAASLAGGIYNEDAFGQMAQQSFDTGIDASAIGQLYGKLQSAGGGGATAYIGGDMARTAQGAFGKGRASEFYTTVTSAIEGAMTRGFEKGSTMFGTGAFKTFAQGLSDLSVHGGATPDAAKSIFGKIQNTIGASASGISTPEQTMQFMMFRKPGESYLDTLRTMSSPESANQRMENLEMLTGGDVNKMTQAVMTEYGVNVHEADRMIKAYKARKSINKSVQKPAGTGTGGTKQVDMDDIKNTTQQQLAAEAALAETTAGLAEKAGNVKTEALKFGVQAIDVIEGVFGHKTFGTGGNTKYSALTKGINRKIVGQRADAWEDIYSNVALYNNPKGASSAQLDYLSANREALGTIDANLTGSFGKSIMSDDKNYKLFIDTLDKMNQKNEDNDMKTFSVTEILNAIFEYMKTMKIDPATTPSGGTP